MVPEFEICLEKARFFARHGVMEQERVVGNEFEVNVMIRVAYSEAIAADNLDATVSYADLFDIVKSEMEKPRQLLEAVAASIVTEIKACFPFVMGGEVSVRKVSPPIPGFTGSASVSLKF